MNSNLKTLASVANYVLVTNEGNLHIQTIEHDVNRIVDKLAKTDLLVKAVEISASMPDLDESWFVHVTESDVDLNCECVFAVDCLDHALGVALKTSLIFRNSRVVLHRHGAVHAVYIDGHSVARRSLSRRK